MTSKLKIALIEPQIPPNTGNIARLCASNDLELHLVGKLGFDLSDKYLKRAGMDYWNYVNWSHHHDVDSYFNELDPEKIHLLTSKRDQSYITRQYEEGDTLIFGSETTGIDKTYLDRFDSACCTIPMLSQHTEIRCLNLSTCVGIVSYEALRQLHLT